MENSGKWKVEKSLYNNPSILDRLILAWMDHTKKKRDKSYHQQKINVNDEVHRI